MKCPKFNKSYTKKPSYDKHISECEKTCLMVKLFQNKLKCPNCSDVFKDNDVFDMHIVICEENNVFREYVDEENHCVSMIYEHNTNNTNDHNDDNQDTHNNRNSDNRNNDNNASNTDNDDTTVENDANNINNDANNADNNYNDYNDNDDNDDANDIDNNCNNNNNDVIYDNDSANNNGNCNEQIDPLLYNFELADSTLVYLKTLRHQSKRSSIKHKEFANLCNLLFRDKFSNLKFMEALSEDLRFDTVDILFSYIDLGKIDIMKRGKCFADKQSRQKMYNHWLNNCEISTDRRNARHLVKKKKSKLFPSIQDLEDSNITESATEKGIKCKAQIYIYILNVWGYYIKILCS